MQIAFVAYGIWSKLGAEMVSNQTFNEIFDEYHPIIRIHFRWSKPHNFQLLSDYFEKK